MSLKIPVLIFFLPVALFAAPPIKVTHAVSGNRLDITLTNVSADKQDLEFSVKNPAEFEWPLGWPYKTTLEKGRSRILTMNIRNTSSYSKDWTMKTRKSGTTTWTSHSSTSSTASTTQTTTTPQQATHVNVPQDDPAIAARDAMLTSGSYFLPYSNGASFRMTNGPMQYGWHQNQNAYDWPMPVGKNICAAKSGTVAAVKSDSNRGGASQTYLNDANYVIIRHSDGTLANYLHLSQNSVTVRVGQKVAAGTLVGKSGQTGWATEPHLHFHVADASGRTLPLKFLTRNGVQTLTSGNAYPGHHPWRGQNSLPTDCP
ncbi:MAG: M23 family metallopeptidase [Leptospirales bacterium]|nr:M23 family metallopeptidase [Leptospirales bacterium]